MWQAIITFIPASISHNKFRAKLLSCPWVIAILRFRNKHLFFVYLTASRSIATIGRWSAITVTFHGKLSLHVHSLTWYEGGILTSSICYKSQNIAQRKAWWLLLLLHFNHFWIVIWVLFERRKWGIFNKQIYICLKIKAWRTKQQLLYLYVF